VAIMAAADGAMVTVGSPAVAAEAASLGAADSAVAMGVAAADSASRAWVSKTLQQTVT
jgi:hypothetical protein